VDLLRESIAAHFLKTKFEIKLMDYAAI